MDGTQPTLYYFCDSTGNGPCSHGAGSSPPYITLNASHNIEFGMQDGSCPSTANGMICGDPKLVNEPSQTWTSESALDVFNPFVAGNSFYPASGSPLIGAGIHIPGLTTDYYGTTRPTSPSIGGVE
jgi:hypothetical protein